MWLGYYTQRAPSWIDTIHFLYQILCGQNRSVKSQCSAEFHHKFPPGHVAFSLCDVSVGPVFGSEIDSLRHKWRSDFEAVSCDNGDNTLVRLDVCSLGLVMVRNLNKVLDQTSTTFVQNGLGILASGLQKLRTHVQIWGRACSIGFKKNWVGSVQQPRHAESQEPSAYRHIGGFLLSSWNLKEETIGNHLILTYSNAKRATRLVQSCSAMQR